MNYGNYDYRDFKNNLGAFIKWMDEIAAQDKEQAQKDSEFWESVIRHGGLGSYDYTSPRNGGKNYGSIPVTPLTVLDKKQIELLKDYCLTHLPLRRYIIQVLINDIGHLQLKWSGIMFKTDKEEFKKQLKDTLIEVVVINRVYESSRIALDLELSSHAMYTLLSSIEMMKRKFVGES